jgi:hypothetical protein
MMVMTRWVTEGSAGSGECIDSRMIIGFPNQSQAVLQAAEVAAFSSAFLTITGVS